jgi:hypothetical protein
LHIAAAAFGDRERQWRQERANAALRRAERNDLNRGDASCNVAVPDPV